MWLYFIKIIGLCWRQYIKSSCCFPLKDAFSQIIANEGVGTLWNGTLPSLVLVFNPAVQFMFYEAMKRRAGRGDRKVRDKILPSFICGITKMCHLYWQISSFEIFFIGAIAKAIATSATYPLQTVQAILRVIPSYDRSKPLHYIKHLMRIDGEYFPWLPLQFGQYKSDGKGGLVGSLKNVVSLLMDRIK